MENTYVASNEADSRKIEKSVETHLEKPIGI